MQQALEDGRYIGGLQVQGHLHQLEVALQLHLRPIHSHHTVGCTKRI